MTAPKYEVQLSKRREVFGTWMLPALGFERKNRPIAPYWSVTLYVGRRSFTARVYRL